MRVMTKIENKAQYDMLMKRVEELLPLVDDSTPLTDKNSVELDMLTSLINDYEDEHYPIEKPSLIDVIKLRLYERGLSKKELAKKLGVSQSRVSEYMTGKSEPTLKIARQICLQLDIDPAIVLGV